MKIGKLHELWQKMHAVGAQHLLCGSAMGFPISIKEEVATKLGPSVKLLRLRERRRPTGRSDLFRAVGYSVSFGM
jgi:hypothetical protein